jgi:hypothetical protein
MDKGGRRDSMNYFRVVHLCEIIGGELTLSHETSSLRYWSIEEMQDWHTTHEKYTRAARAM